MGYYRFDPTGGFEHVIRQIQHVAEEMEKGVTVETASFRPRIDITEQDKNFTVHIELPGLTKNDVNISVNEDRVLSIKGKKEKDSTEGKTVLRNERKFGEFSRSLQLAEEADIESIKATFTNGVLELGIPKKEPEQPKVIEVQLN